MERAKYAEDHGDEATEMVASLISCVDADPSDVELLNKAAGALIRYVNRQAIPKARRGIYLANVRAHMERAAKRLDATAMSRLAWLFLLEGDESKAADYAKAGLRKERKNTHCLGILERLRTQ